MYDPEVSFEHYLKFLSDNYHPETVQEGSVHSVFLLAENSRGELVGRISIRFELNDFLFKVGGHVGYAVLQEHRQKGYGTEILRAGIEYIKLNSKLDSILITCDEDNIPSAKIIEVCGGVFEDLYSGPEVQVPKKRYWLKLD